MSKELENEQNTNTTEPEAAVATTGTEPAISEPVNKESDTQINSESVPTVSSSEQSETKDSYKYTEDELKAADDDYKLTEDDTNAGERIETISLDTVVDPVTETKEEDEDDNKKKKKKRIIAIIIAVIIIILLLLLRSCGGCGTKPTDPSKPGLELEGDNAWDGTIQDPDAAVITDSIEIPGYSNLGVSKDKPTIRLGNPEANTVYLQYQITKDDEVIYETKAIKPGNMVEANLYDVLETGENEVTISINTYDIDTETACNGATQTITITVY